MQRYRLIERQAGERLLGFFGERPGLEAASAERQFRRLQSDQAHLPSVPQLHRVAVDDLDHHTRFVATRQARRQGDVGGGAGDAA